jgi:hypothetical protein
MGSINFMASLPSMAPTTEKCPDELRCEGENGWELTTLFF